MSMTQDFRQLTQIWGNVYSGNAVSVEYSSTTEDGAQTPNICIRWMWDAAWTVLKAQPQHIDIIDILTSPKVWPCGGNGVCVHPYNHTTPEKVLKHLTYVSDGCRMQFERFYSLKHSIEKLYEHLYLQEILLISTSEVTGQAKLSKLFCALPVPGPEGCNSLFPVFC